MKNNIEEILLKNEAPRIDKNIKKSNITNLKVEISNATICKKEKFMSMLLKQFSYMSKIIFVVQFLLLLIGIEIIKINSFRDTNILITFVVSILTLFQIFEMEKSFKYKMYEIEMSSKINLKMLVAIRIIILSSINLLISTMFAIFIGIKFKYEIPVVILHFLVPMLMINVVNIEISKRFKTNEIIKLFITVIVNIFLLLVHIQLPQIYEISSTIIWLVTFCISLMILIKNIYELWNKEEEFIWNLR